MNKANRVFILGGRGLQEEEWREIFERYGTITDIWSPKDRRSGEDKGITYITFDKTSEACRAVEESNRITPAKCDRPLKVIFASERGRDGGRDADELSLLRLFVVVPKGQEEEDVREHFEQFGELEYVRMHKDYKTNKPKGLAYVKFKKQYDAAKALEECNQAYKPLFADDHRSMKRSHSDRYGGRDNYGSGRDNYAPPPPPMQQAQMAHSPMMDMLPNYSNNNQRILEVMVAPGTSQEQIYRLFDLIPGMRNCSLDSKTGVAMVEYYNPQSAAYAKEKANNMEFPPGHRLAVRYEVQAPNRGGAGYMAPDVNFGDVAANLNMNIAQVGMGAGGGAPNSNSIQTLVDSIQKATQVLQSAGIQTGPNMPTTAAATSMATSPPCPLPPVSTDLQELPYCNVPLPPKQPFAPCDSPVGERLFIVSQPDPFPDDVLEDVLCRFGDFIEAYFMPDKTYGYAKFASKQAAAKAIETLHLQQVCGKRFKLVIADPPKSGSYDDGPDRKRMR